MKDGARCAPWVIGGVLALAGVIGAHQCAPGDLREWSEDPTGCPPLSRETEASVRERQRNARACRLVALQGERRLSAARIEALRLNLDNARSNSLVGARRALKEELAEMARIEGEIRPLVVEPDGVAWGALWMAALTLATLTVTWLLGATLSKPGTHGSPAASFHGTSPGEVVGVALVLFVANTIQELKTSVLAAQKDSFGFASFAVSPWSWGWVRVMALGLCLAFAYALASAWDAADPDRRPRPDPAHMDGGFGLVRYVTAWRWLILAGATASLVIAVGEVVAIAYGRDRFNGWYLLTPAFGLVATAAPIVRAARRVQELSVKCREARWLAAKSGGGVAIPEDPTQAFWEVPFKIPAFLLVAASLAWLALEQTGVASAILRTLSAGSR